MLYIIVAAIALVLVLEGILPAAAPGIWKQMLIFFSVKSDRIIRIMGLIMMILGAVIFFLAHQYLS